MGITLNINADVRLHVVDPGVLPLLTRLERKIDRVLLIGDKLMAASAEVSAFLDQLNTYTNELAQAQAVQTEKISNIAADIARLAEGTELSPEVRERLVAAAAGLQSAVAFETAQAATLTALAEQTADPLPPPVDPPVDPPVEG